MPGVLILQSGKVRDQLDQSYRCPDPFYCNNSGNTVNTIADTVTIIYNAFNSCKITEILIFYGISEKIS